MDMRYFDRYVAAQKEAMRYVRADVCIPNDLEGEQVRSLKDLRYYLDEIGKRMPPPKFYFDIKDKTTWKYLDVAHTKRMHTKEILNPDFKYKDKY